MLDPCENVVSLHYVSCKIKINVTYFYCVSAWKHVGLLTFGRPVLQDGLCSSSLTAGSLIETHRTGLEISYLTNVAVAS